MVLSAFWLGPKEISKHTAAWGHGDGREIQNSSRAPKELRQKQKRNPEGLGPIGIWVSFI